MSFHYQIMRTSYEIFVNILSVIVRYLIFGSREICIEIYIKISGMFFSFNPIGVCLE